MMAAPACKTRLHAEEFRSSPQNGSASTTATKVFPQLTEAMLRIHVQKQAGKRVLSPNAFKSMPASIISSVGTTAENDEQHYGKTLTSLCGGFELSDETAQSSSSDTTKAKVNKVVSLNLFAKAGLLVYRKISLG
eukprot:TRINITY_DN6049_c0_g2_i1.p1 TRINITY_DN6049_c0_g2~~TRINITY_DN6049_c0_g2_i1.p1  ORF type:complete len:135 (-),score=20.97 TRINITY_DN6049_c0_g2_i1:133-537(-)